MIDDLYNESVWSPPEELPNLSDAPIMAIDVETRDPNLKTLGPGWVRNDGNLIGVAVAVDGWCAYLPFGHGDIGDSRGYGNMSKTLVLRWLKGQLAHGMPVVFHNAQYDLGWLLSEGVDVRNPILDTMVAAPLLDENRFSYALNSLGATYLGERKQEDDLRRAAAQHGVDAKAEMWKLPAARVALYAQTDARLTLELWHVLSKKIRADDCQSILDLELSLLPTVFEMRRRGVRVDLEKAERTKKGLLELENKLLTKVKKETGIWVEPWNARSLASVFDKLGLEYGRTAKSGAPSFTKQFLKTHEHPIARNILEIREYNKANTTFVDTILSHQHEGRIHCEFNQLRSDGGGTVTGRFSSSHPNLQQMPARHPEIKKLIRGLFLPEEGCRWGSFDYSAQEPRWLVHYACQSEGTKDDSVVQKIMRRYHEDDFDFHQMVADLAGVDRTLAKTLNLGIMYGMGIAKMATVLGDTSFQEAKALRDEYEEEVPFIRKFATMVMEQAQLRKEVRTFLGRKCRFPMRERPRERGSPVHYETMEAEWQQIMETPEANRAATYGTKWRLLDPDRLRVSFTYKALNKLIQASSADQTKQAMADCTKNGYLPMLTVHDELCFSIETDRQVGEIKELMEKCVEMRVPSKIDVGIGADWGAAK
ncbi:MAG: DNA polymerase-1 [Chloroflexi bacterium]|jgi:DNA polymerase I-like protein with 3'-5' exonuclease and polymerase domains|nr:MAG: DNA polymerase-1 [Chloroflexota bacterium]